MDVVVSAAALLPTYNMPPPPTQKPTHTASFDDTRLWCVDCGCTIPGLRCKTHGDTTHIRDRTIPCRAKLTAPHLITIRTVELRPGEHNKFAVFAKKVIQKRTEFGPYEGAPQNVWRYGISPERDRLMLKLFKSDGSSHFLDCTDETYCNWMMYIRPASNHAEQNLAAFQCKGAIYYVSTKAISPNVELRVWYTDPYAAAMGYPVHRPMSIVQVDPYAAAHTRIVPYRDDDDDDEDDDEDDDAISVTTGNMSHDVHDYDDEDDHDDDPDYKCTEVIINTKGNHNGRGFELMGSFTQDGRFECNKCHSLFDSMLECQNHPCVTEDIPPKAKSPPPLPDPAAMRRKRKINPSKAVPEVTPVPKKKGRPPKLNNVKGIGKGTGRPRGRPKGSTNSAAKVRRRPLKVRTPKTLHECDLCGKAFLNDSKLKVHMFTHSGERPFLCSFDSCDKAFTSKFKVMRHELIHASDRQHVCIYCLKTFSRKDHLKHHLRIHDPNKSMHQCEECGKMYASSYAYRTHLAFHAADRGQMTCAVCKEDFADKETLKKHLKAHAGARSIKDSTEKRQKCDFCDKTFFTIKDVKRHAVVHTKDRDYLCQYCPQKFGRRDHLVRHLKKTHVRSSVTGEISNVGTTAITITQPKKEGKKVSESINTMATVVQLVQPEQQAQMQVQVQTQQQMQNQVQQQTQQIIHQPVPQETQHNAQQIVQQQAQHLAQQSAQHAQQQAQQQAQLLTQQLQQQQAQQQQAQQQLLQKQQLHLQKQQLAQQQQDAQQEQLLQQKVQQQHQLQQQVQLQQQEQQPELAQTSEVPQLAAVSQVPQLAGNSGDTLESQRLLLDPAMISKLIQSVARGIPDPSMVPDDIGTSHQPQPQPQAETHAQAVQQQQSAVSLQSGNGALQVQTVSLQLQQQRQAAQLKGKNILGSLSHVTGSNVSQALPNVITSIGMLPGSLLNYQNIGSISVTSPVQTLPTLSTATSTTAAATMAAATASRTARIASIAQQLAEPVMSGHFVPPFLPASTLTQTQPTQMIKDTPVQVQPITAVSLLAQQQIQLQQLQQQHLRQHQQQAQQQDQQQKQQAQQQQQQHIIEQPSGTVSSAPSVLAVNSVNTPLLSDGQMHLPIIHPQFITRAEGTQLRLATHANNTQQVQLIRAAPTSQVTQSALSKQMVVVTPLPSSGLGATNIQLSGGHVVTNYADAMKLVLSQLSQSQQTQQQAQQQLVQQQQQQQQQAQQQQQVIQQQQDSQPQTPPQI